MAINRYAFQMTIPYLGRGAGILRGERCVRTLQLCSVLSGGGEYRNYRVKCLSNWNYRVKCLSNWNYRM